jgi:hypothetical protein
VHGLASERGIRAQSGRIGAAVRWQSDRIADPMPRQDEHRQDKPSNRAPAREGFRDPLLNEIRAKQIELYGNGSDAPIVSQPFTTAIEQERETLRLEALALHERFLNGELGPAEYERLRADLGKPDDDLTRVGA